MSRTLPPLDYEPWAPAKNTIHLSDRRHLLQAFLQSTYEAGASPDGCDLAGTRTDECPFTIGVLRG